MFANPQLAFELLPQKFWSSLSNLSAWDTEKVLDQRFGPNIHGIDIPLNSCFAPQFYAADYNNRYDFASMLNSSSDEKKHYLISEKSLKKIATDMLTAVRKSAFSALLQDAEVTSVGAVAFFSNMSVAFPKILKYLGAKFELKIIEGEKFFFVYGSKKIHGELEVLLKGAESEAHIVSIGFGSIAANRIMKSGTPFSILIIASLDIIKHIFKKQETMADLLSELAIDIPQAAAVTAGGALVSLFISSLVMEGVVLPILVFGLIQQ